MLYNIGIRSYGLAVRVASLFNEKAKLWIAGRKDYWNNLPDVKNRNVVWFHCSSLGEYDQGKPIMESWRIEHPEDYILVTFFSPSGYENIKDKSVGDYTCYLPLDTPKNAEKFIQHFQPKNSFFIKYEIWINYINEAKKHGSKVYSISASFRENQRFFKWYGQNFRNALKQFDHIFVQKESSKALLNKIDITAVTVSGDTRYDRVIQRAQENRENAIIAPWVEGEQVFIVGSSWAPDEEIIIPYINDFKIQNRVIIAPHDVNESRIKEITSKLKVSYQLYTKVQEGEVLKPYTTVLIMDCIGVLAEAYRYGNLAYVGGGFGTGLHNILEPAAFGLPVIFGPEFKKFPEAQDFIDAEIGNSCDDGKSFYDAYTYYLGNKQATERVKNFVNSQKGATDIVFNVLS